MQDPDPAAIPKPPASDPPTAPKSPTATTPPATVMPPAPVAPVTPPAEGRPLWGFGQFGLFLLAACLLVALALWPWKIRSLAVLWAPATHQDLGMVQKVSFIGSWDTDTQIETPTVTVLLHGVASFQRGTALELRSDFFSHYVCQAGTDHCNRLIATPATLPAPVKPGC